ncbi:hypothetical protein PT974_12269 [Cladobotryum mycophilum]|uniref:Uncharacterized protein n=1 Tax=Cladobotryum mycophilum TaxID=491253 RepID=A0ABR0S834_9HYPO
MPSHRRLVHRHMRRLLSKAPQDLLPGEARFYSFYQPSLQGGVHTITAEQTIEADGQKQVIKSEEQNVNIIAPKYNLPPDIVDSVYPPSGGSAPVTVLPHIVFKDPHMPWERSPGYVDYKAEDNDIRSIPSWMVLLVFTIDELKLEQTEFQTILKPVGLGAEDARQGETMAVKMRAKDTAKLDNVVNVIPFNPIKDAHDAEGPVDVLFMKKELFTSLFTTVDPVTKQSRLDVAQYKYMAHVRQVATDGMASAGADEDTGLFSIVISPRTGPLGLDKATTTVVHLVSLDMRKGLSPILDKDRVAMVSLHSWTYNCLPSEGDASPKERLIHLGEKINVLHPQMPDEADTPGSVQEIITKRQQDGYTLVRHRTITGESTAAMTRGPLVPNPIRHPLRDGFNIQSNFGSDLQILDPKLSLMDITYASAWQLGKTLAMGDEAFSASLTRLRGVIHGAAVGESKIDVHRILGTHKSRKDTLLGMHDLVKSLNHLSERLMEQGDLATAVDGNRWDYSTSYDGADLVDISMHSPHISTRMHSHADAAALSSAQATDGTMYNEHNCPENSDFAYVYSWVLDKLHLANVPAHYLLPDPSYLPQETLRFFYLDENWTDALVDGALSLANHWGYTPKEDFCRTAIKKTINKKLITPDPALGGWHTQMPRYGFILRSQLLVQFPDITVTPKFAEIRLKMIDNKLEAPKAPILVQNRLSADSMYCLFDCLPGDLDSITFTMPPHQQRFTIGTQIDNTLLKVSFRRIFTIPNHGDRQEKDYKTPIDGPPFP